MVALNLMKQRGDPPEPKEAMLSKAISYNKDGVSILVPQGTRIVVDQQRQVALIGEDHVDVCSDEYTLLGMWN